MGKITLTAFNVATQKDEVCDGYFDNNDELVLTFKNGSFIKVPKSIDTKVKLDKYLAGHRTNNIGQVSVEAKEKDNAERMRKLGLLGPR